MFQTNSIGKKQGSCKIKCRIFATCLNSRSVTLVKSIRLPIARNRGKAINAELHIDIFVTQNSIPRLSGILQAEMSRSINVTRLYTYVTELIFARLRALEAFRRHKAGYDTRWIDGRPPPTRTRFNAQTGVLNKRSKTRRTSVASAIKTRIPWVQVQRLSGGWAVKGWGAAKG